MAVAYIVTVLAYILIPTLLIGLFYVARRWRWKWCTLPGTMPKQQEGTELPQQQEAVVVIDCPAASPNKAKLPTREQIDGGGGRYYYREFSGEPSISELPTDQLEDEGPVVFVLEDPGSRSRLTSVEEAREEEERDTDTMPAPEIRAVSVDTRAENVSIVVGSYYDKAFLCPLSSPSSPSKYLPKYSITSAMLCRDDDPYVSSSSRGLARRSESIMPIKPFSVPSSSKLVIIDCEVETPTTEGVLASYLPFP